MLPSLDLSRYSYNSLQKFFKIKTGKKLLKDFFGLKGLPDLSLLSIEVENKKKTEILKKARKVYI